MSMGVSFHRDARYLTSMSGLFNCTKSRLLRVELDDQLFLDLGVDHLAGRQRVHQDPHLVGDDLKPRRHRPGPGLGAGDHERGQLARGLAHLDDVVLGDPVGRDVHLAAVDDDVAVAHQLAGGVAGLGEAGPVNHVVQPRFEDLQHDLAGLAGLLVGLGVVAAELLLQHAIDPAGLLLLAQLEQVFAVLAAAAAVLTRRVRPDLDRALRAVAFGALEEELHLFAAAQLAVWTGITSHLYLISFTRSDPAALRRPAPVVRLRRDVLNGADLKTRRLQRTDRGLPARAGALDEDIDLAHAVLLRLARGALGGHLGGERGGLARRLEADMPGRGPGHHVAGRVGDRHDRVVERALDMGVTVRDVLLFPAPDLLGARAGASLGWHVAVYSKV